MNQILEALKCVNCRNTLSQPVFLPCGHLICQIHTFSSNQEKTICFKCGARHPNSNFVIAEAVSNLIAAQLETINFGEKHTLSVKFCEKLGQQIDENNAILNEADLFIHESIGEIKRQLLLKSEQLKTLIDEINDEIVRDLDKFEQSCKNNFSSNEFTTRLDAFKEIIEVSKTKYDEWKSDLDRLSIDEAKWERIQNDSESTFKELRTSLERFKHEIFQGQLEKNKKKSCYYDEIGIFALLKSNEPNKWFQNVSPIDFDSKIIVNSKLKEFSDLCEFHEEDRFELLYRASRDGFRPKDFHLNCDEHRSTLTILETTKGYIFGGFTSAFWTSEIEGFKSDPNAYLFSLVNHVNKPFLSRVVDWSRAIGCSKKYGPVFGNFYENQGNTICVCEKSNESSTSYAYLDKRAFSLPSFAKDKNGAHFTNTKYFQVKEIEVFKIITSNSLQP